MFSRMKYVRIAALLLALFTIVVSMVGIVFPDSVTTLRRSYYAQGGLYAAGAVRVSIGLVLILAALSSRWPRTLQAVGAVMCLQGLAANLLGLDRARDPRMGGDTYGALARWGRGGFGHQWLRRVRAYNEAVRRKQETSSLAISN